MFCEKSTRRWPEFVSADCRPTICGCQEATAVLESGDMAKPGWAVHGALAVGTFMVSVVLLKIVDENGMNWKHHFMESYTWVCWRWFKLFLVLDQQSTSTINVPEAWPGHQWGVAHHQEDHWQISMLPVLKLTKELVDHRTDHALEQHIPFGDLPVRVEKKSRFWRMCYNRWRLKQQPIRNEGPRSSLYKRLRQQRSRWMHLYWTSNPFFGGWPSPLTLDDIELEHLLWGLGPPYLYDLAYRFKQSTGKIAWEKLVAQWHWNIYSFLVQVGFVLAFSVMIEKVSNALFHQMEISSCPGPSLADDNGFGRGTWCGSLQHCAENERRLAKFFHKTVVLRVRNHVIAETCWTLSDLFRSLLETTIRTTWPRSTSFLDWKKEHHETVQSAFCQNHIR